MHSSVVAVVSYFADRWPPVADGRYSAS